MNEKEKQVMLEHVTDLKSFADKGTVIVIGPVMDPEGPGDLAVADAEYEENVRSMIAKNLPDCPALDFRWGSSQYFWLWSGPDGPPIALEGFTSRKQLQVL